MTVSQLYIYIYVSHSRSLSDVEDTGLKTRPAPRSFCKSLLVLQSGGGRLKACLMPGPVHRDLAVGCPCRSRFSANWEGRRVQGTAGQGATV